MSSDASREEWTLAVDGSSNARGSGLGVVLTLPEGHVIERSIQCRFKTTNNEAEYEALTVELTLAKDLHVERIKVQLQASFESFDIEQIPRSENTHADTLANLDSALDTTVERTIPMVFTQWPAVWKPAKLEVEPISDEPT
ncbi:hypothetical protein ACOSQ3_013813 [Xanthoceras sorbifolium]